MASISFSLLARSNAGAESTATQRPHTPSNTDSTSTTGNTSSTGNRQDQQSAAPN
ncbi:Protein of unknown function [Propionibacterium freudenreichii]|nr:Protein of unknown function [Propionibacterium freudenreichii]